MSFFRKLYLSIFILTAVMGSCSWAGETSLQPGGIQGTSAPATSILPLVDLGVRKFSKWVSYYTSSGSGAGDERETGSGSGLGGEGELDNEQLSMPRSVYIPEGMTQKKIISGLRHPNDESDESDSAYRALNTLDSLKGKGKIQGKPKEAIAKDLRLHTGASFNTNDLKYYTDSFQASIQRSRLMSQGYKPFLTINPKRSFPKQEFVRVPKCSINPNPRGPGYPEGYCPAGSTCKVTGTGNMVFVYRNGKGQLKVSVIQDHVNTKAACVREGKGKRKRR